MKMAEHRALLGALPLLARAMGKQYGVKVVFGSTGASTDGKTIFLPPLAPDDPDTAALAAGFIDHESGHVRDTDMATFERVAIKSPLAKSILNVHEDVRIEKLMAGIYPGCRTNLARLVKKMVRLGRFSAVDEANPAKLISGYLLYTLRSNVLKQTGLDELAADAAAKMDATYPGLRAELDRTAFAVENATSTEDCASITEEVIEVVERYIKEPPKPPQQPDADKKDQEDDSSDSDQQDNDSGQGQQEDQGEDDTQGQGADGDGDESEQGDSQSDSEQDSGAGNSAQSGEDASDESEDSASSSSASGDESEDSEDPGQSAQGGWDEEQAKTLEQLFQAEDDDFVQNLGEMLQEKLEEESEKQTYGYSSDGLGSSEPATDFRASPLNKGRVAGATNALRVRLNGLLQAKQSVRNLPRRHGRKLDARMIPRVRAGVEQRAFRGRNERQGLNTAVHVLLDRSGSMGGPRMSVANDCMLAVKLALESHNQVNLGISAFPGRGGGSSTFFPLVRHGQKRADSDIGLHADGGTPLGDALWGVAHEMWGLKEERKIIIVLTDGGPDNPPGCHTAVGCLERLGFELVGIGIQHPAVGQFFKNSSVVNNVAELPQRLFEQLERLLVR